MSIEDNVETVKAFFAAMGGGDKQAMFALAAEDIVLRDNLDERARRSG
jgi:uncharacterized protein